MGFPLTSLLLLCYVSRMPKPRELTLKRQALVKVFPTATSKAQAGRLAGYKGGPDALATSVNRALNNAKVQEALKAETASLAEISGVTPEWALKHLKANVERSMQAVPVTDSDGNVTGVWRYEPNAVNKGVELALRFNKLLGEDQQPQKAGDTYNQVVLQGYSVEELETMLEQVRPRPQSSLLSVVEPLKEEPKAIPALGRQGFP